MLPRRRVRSCRSVERQKIAITSEATVMSKPSSRGKPLEMPPSEDTMLRSARAFMSMMWRLRCACGEQGAPGGVAFVDAELVAPVVVIVDEGGEQVVGGADGVEVAG